LCCAAEVLLYLVSCVVKSNVHTIIAKKQFPVLYKALLYCLIYGDQILAKLSQLSYSDCN